MPTTQDISELLRGYDVLIGGVGPTIEIEEFNSQEMDLFDSFVNYAVEQLSLVSPNLANIFNEQKDLILTFAKIFKAKIGGKAFGGITPSSAQFGIGMLIPYDLKYKADAPTVYDGRTWKISTTAGTPVYLLGSATTFYKANDVVGSRSMLLILKNGLIELGTTPKFDQMQVLTEKVTYTPFRLSPFADIPIEKEKPLYIYVTPMAIPVWYDFGIKVSLMPNTSGVSDLRLLGVVYYEYGYYNTLK